MLSPGPWVPRPRCPSTRPNPNQRLTLSHPTSFRPARSLGSPGRGRHRVPRAAPPGDQTPHRGNVPRRRTAHPEVPPLPAFGSDEGAGTLARRAGARPGRIPERTAPLSPQAEKAVPTRRLRLPCPPLRAWAFGLVDFSWKYCTRKPPLPLEHWRQSWALRLTSPRDRGPHAGDAETLFFDRRTRAAPQVRLSAQVPILEVGRKASRVHISPTQVNRKTDFILSAGKHQGGARLVKILFQPWFHLHTARKILLFYA